MDALPANSETAAEPLPAEDLLPARKATRLYTFRHMHLKVGDRLHLEPPRRIAGGRASLIMLGWFEGKSVITTAPQNGAGRVLLLEGEPVLVRAFTGKNVFAFRSTVLKIAYIPFDHLHLRFPDTVEGVAIRRSPRCRLHLSVRVTAGGIAAGAGSILDIGTAGALIETATPLGQDEELIQIAFSFDLDGVPVSLNLQAQVRGRKTSLTPDGEPRHQYGVEFRNLQPNDRLILGSLVWYHVYEHPSSAA